jgi:UDP-galactopyranose mutase
VLAKIGEQFLPIPINIDTVNRLYGLSLTEKTIQSFYDRVREPRENILTSEDVVLNAVGRDLYEKFFRGYTRKHWGLDPSELAASVAARIPTRANRDDRYFTDQFQRMPLHGYTRLFERMLDRHNIHIELGIDFAVAKRKWQARHLVFTGPIDEYFGYCYGRLPYRSLRFEHEHLPDVVQYQRVGTVNYPNDHAFTRITEFKHLTGQSHRGTSIVREYPQSQGDPYYPIPRPENEALFKRYDALARKQNDVSFVGRLAQYRYYNMDQCVGAALKTAEYVLAKFNTPAVVPAPEKGEHAATQAMQRRSAV